MAVQSTNDYSGPFTPDGATTSFPFDFVALSADEVAVVRVGATVDTLTGYTVTLESDGSGTVNFTLAPAAGDPLYVVSDPSFEQQTDFGNQQSFSGLALTRALDRAAARDIALQAGLTRTLMAPPTDTLGVLPSASTRAGLFLVFDGDGLASLANGTGADAGLRTDLSATSGAAIVGFLNSGTGAVSRSVQTKIRERGIAFEDFGAVGDGTTNDRAAILAARTAAIAANADIILTPGKNYNVGSTLTDISGVAIRPGKGSIISGNVDLQQDIRPRGDSLRVDVSSSGVKFTHWVNPERPYSQRRTRLPEGSLKRITGSRIDATTLTVEQVAWPSADSWTSSTPSALTADAWTPNATTGNIWYGGFAAAKPGMTLRGTMAAGTYVRGILVRWSGGYIVLYGTLTNAQVFVKNTGVAGTTATLTWSGQSDHPQWSMDNAELGIRVYDLTTVGFLINGYEVYRATIAGVIQDVGLGVFANSGAVTPAVSWITSTSEKGSFAGQQSLSFSVFGDSLSAPYASGATTSIFTGSWLETFREAIDRSPQGVKVTGWNNYAVAGYNSANILTQFGTYGVGVSNYIILFVGTNDVQGASALSASIANLTSVLTGIASAGRKAVVVIPPLWLNSDQGTDGQSTLNAQNAAPLRAAFRSLALQNNALIVDLTQLTGQILTNYYTDSSLSDGALRDRIHPTDFLYDAIGHEIASVVLGDIARQITKRFNAIAIPTAWRLNGWVTTTEAAYIECTEAGLYRMFGIYDAGTKTDGTVIMKTPPSIRPATPRRFQVRTSSGATARVDWQTGGNLVINGLGTDNWITLDGINLWAA